jgi:hypothetical protein
MEKVLVWCKIKHLYIKLILLISQSFFLENAGHHVYKLFRLSLVITDLLFHPATYFDPLTYPEIALITVVADQGFHRQVKCVQLNLADGPILFETAPEVLLVFLF